jgi:GNAT superfamily N-acetyltransferase
MTASPSVDVRPLDAQRVEEAIETITERLPHLPRVEAGLPFESPDLFPLRVCHTAHDEHDRIVAVGLVQRVVFAPPQRCALRIIVARDAEGAGVGSALRTSLLRHVPATMTKLGSGVFDDDRRSLAVARHWGFEIEKHAIESSLALADVASLPQSPLPPGVTLHEVPDLQFADADAVGRMLLASQTNPEAAIGFVMTLEGFGSMLGPGEQPVCVVARVGDTPAGITFGGVQAGVLSIAYSGVDPAFRGRGIMRVVKERAHVVAARLGATVSNTTNEEHNAGIRRVNADLGYVVRSGTYRMVQDLQPS